VSESSAMMFQLEKNIQQNAVKHFGPLPPKDKTVEKVEAFAQRQLDIFIEALIRESPEMWKKWKGGHPFTAKAVINRATLEFGIKIVEPGEKGKW
jgi:hypothetical protein